MKENIKRGIQFIVHAAYQNLLMWEDENGLKPSSADFLCKFWQ